MSGTSANMPDLVRYSATELSALIHKREVSCVEVMLAYLKQIEDYNPALNAIVGLRSHDELVSEARARDAELSRGVDRGWMHGMPHAFKDLLAVRGLPYTMGSPVFADRIAEADDLVAKRIRAAGAIVIGKTNTSEFGLGSQTYNPVWGVTANPYDTSRTAGGSSGGGAAALAARMVPVADGSDNMGSLRNPPAFNNVLGLRPSWGRVPSPGFVAGCSVHGGMARTTADLARLIATMAGPDTHAPLGIEESPGKLYADLSRSFEGTRVAWVGDWGGYLPMEQGIMDLCESALLTLEQLGCRVEPVRPAFDPEEIWQAYLTWRSWGNLTLADLYQDPGTRALLKPEAIWEVERGLNLSGLDFARAAAVRGAWYATAADMFSTYEYVVAPSAQTFPFAKSLHWPTIINGRAMDTYHRWMETVVPWTMIGHPVGAVPAGFDQRGLPTGVQIVGRHRADHAVLQIMQAYEQAIPWLARVPDMVAGPTKVAQTRPGAVAPQTRGAEGD